MALMMMALRGSTINLLPRNGFIGLLHDSKRLLSWKVHSQSFHSEEQGEEKFDRSSYRNDVQLIGKAAANPNALHDRRRVGHIYGYRFPLEIPQNDFPPVRCTILSYSSADDSLTNYIAQNVRKGQTLKVKGFFRKSVKVYDNTKHDAEGSYQIFYSIGPKSIEIVDEDASSIS